MKLGQHLVLKLRYVYGYSQLSAVSQPDGLLNSPIQDKSSEKVNYKFNIKMGRSLRMDRISARSCAKWRRKLVLSEST